MALALVAVGLAMLNVLSRANSMWGVGDLSTLVWTGIAGSLVLLANSSDFWRSRLRFRLSRLVADRSYSLYLVHIEAVAPIKHVPNATFLSSLALTWISSFVLAEVLYQVVERPFVRAREQWTWSRERLQGSFQPSGSSLSTSDDGRRESLPITVLRPAQAS
jgi:peptidoglycan/LPS O-acetylase OafA/YrhL